jgi:hypothetical protein
MKKRPSSPSDDDDDVVTHLTEEEEEEEDGHQREEASASRRRRRDDDGAAPAPPRNELAVSLGTIPKVYDSSIMQWFQSVMPALASVARARRSHLARELEVLAELDVDGQVDTKRDAVVPADVKDTLKKMLIFFSESDRNRHEISILSRYCNMNVYISTSLLDRAGLGLFVAHDKDVIKPGQRLTEYGGLRIARDRPYNFDSVYVLDVYNNAEPRELLYRIDAAHSFRLEQAARWANRSRVGANAELIYYDDEDASWLVSTKPIAAHEEIVWWYGDNFSQSVTRSSSSSQEEDEDERRMSWSIRERLSGFYI